MLKKILLLFTIFILSQTFIFANENATDIIVEYEGFCPNYPIEFVLFNQTQYEDKDKIEKDLCEDDETPKEDRCEVWEGFKGKVSIYNGPMDGMPLLKEFNLDKQRDFTVTFPSTNDYLIKFEPSDENKYNEWEETIALFECKFSEKNKDKYPEENKPKVPEKTNQTFLYDNNEFVLDIESTTFKDKSEITVELISNEKLNNSLKSFKINNQDNTKEFQKYK